MAPQHAPVVAVLNMKGGVGKTTISAHVMHKLFATRPVRVLLIDLDPQFNLTQTLVSRSLYDIHLADDRSVFAAMEPPSTVGLFDVAVASSAPPSVSTLAVELRRRTTAGTKRTLDLVPGDFRLVKYSVIDDQVKLGKVRQRFARFISEARRQYDLVCIDCNPSSSFLTLCALHNCTHLLAPVRPDRYSVLGLELLTQFVEQLPTLYPKPDLGVLINGVPSRSYDRTIENELRSHDKLGGNVLASTLRQTTFLSAGPTGTSFAGERGGPHSYRFATELAAVASEVATFTGLTT